MKVLKFTLLSFAILSLFQSCQKDETEPKRSTHVVTLENNTSVTGCGGNGLEVTFLISYRDIQVDVDVEKARSAIINVLVEDGESINVKVQRTSDDSPLADANVTVRTDSRPDHLENEHRRISYCSAFDLNFLNF